MRDLGFAPPALAGFAIIVTYKSLLPNDGNTAGNSIADYLDMSRPPPLLSNFTTCETTRFANLPCFARRDKRGGGVKTMKN